MSGLQADGFYVQNGALFDKGGNTVEFSIVTNAGTVTLSNLMVTDVNQTGGGSATNLDVVRRPTNAFPERPFSTAG